MKVYRTKWSDHDNQATLIQISQKPNKLNNLFLLGNLFFNIFFSLNIKIIILKKTKLKNISSKVNIQENNYNFNCITFQINKLILLQF